MRISPIISFPFTVDTLLPGYLNEKKKKERENNGDTEKLTFIVSTFS